MNLEFRPVLKSINIASEDLTKITLEVKNDSLNGKYDELRKLSNKTVNLVILPESYNYTQEFDRSTKKPIQEWIINKDGTTELRKTEQTQLDIDEQGNIDIEKRVKNVNKEIIDEFIMKATTIEVPSDIIINPRDVIVRLSDGEDFGEVAESYEMSDVALLNELEKARQHFAPFADAWDKVRNEVVFEEIQSEKAEEEPESENKTVEEKEAEESSDSEEEPVEENATTDSEEADPHEASAADETANNEDDTDTEEDPY